MKTTERAAYLGNVVVLAESLEVRIELCDAILVRLACDLGNTFRQLRRMNACQMDS